MGKQGIADLQVENLSTQLYTVSYECTEAPCHWDENKRLCDHLLMVNNSTRCVGIGCQHQDAADYV